MPTLKLTSKHQVTFPRGRCEELGVRDGDRLTVDRSVVNGKPMRVLRPYRMDWSWIGGAQVPEGTSHDTHEIRSSIGRGIARARR